MDSPGSFGHRPFRQFYHSPEHLRHIVVSVGAWGICVISVMVLIGLASLHMFSQKVFCAQPGMLCASMPSKFREFFAENCSTLCKTGCILFCLSSIAALGMLRRARWAYFLIRWLTIMWLVLFVIWIAFGGFIFLVGLGVMAAAHLLLGIESVRLQFTGEKPGGHNVPAEMNLATTCRAKQPRVAPTTESAFRRPVPGRTPSGPRFGLAPYPPRKRK